MSRPVKMILLRDDAKEINRLKALNDRPAPMAKQDLPEPSFRRIEDTTYRRRPKKKKSEREKEKESYIRYHEPTPMELMNLVEYDMDDLDEEFLNKMNEILSKEFDYKLSETDFELIMDNLEKESYFDPKNSSKNAPVDEDADCAICLNGECHSDTNQIIFCDMCDLPVHQECYGVPYIPEGQWLCRKCQQSPSGSVKCILCPNTGGAFKQTDNGHWAHVICALWIPEACFANTVFLEPIDISAVPEARNKLTCYICKQKKDGYCIQCHKPNCYAPFHVTCAQQAGLHMRIRKHSYMGDAGPYIDVMKEAYCDAHAPKDKSKKRAMYSDDETETEEDDIESKNYFKKRSGTKKDSISKTRKILAEKRASDPNPVNDPIIEDKKLSEISKKISIPKRRVLKSEKLKEEIMRRVQGYWLIKRRDRKGVPLIRRLQVKRSTKPEEQPPDRERYERLRYDLEKARLLVGDVKRREVMKKKLFKISKNIVELRYKIIEMDSPATEN